jgi:uncharacterized protein
MVGRLARYLRFVGCDTEYVRGVSDEEILNRARSEGRILVTRDRELARRAAGAVLIASPLIADQWKETCAAIPALSTDVRFDRCSECNGPLAGHRPQRGDPGTEGVPWGRVETGLPVFRCTVCGHLYWEGTHTERIRRQLAEWSAGPP